MFFQVLLKMNQILEEQFQAIDNYWKSQDQIYEKVAKKLDITCPSLIIYLFLLRTRERVTQNQIVEYWLYPKQTVSYTIQHRMQDGRIDMSFLSGSKKEKGIYLTDKGKEFCKNKILPVREAEDKAFSSLSEKERNALVEITKKHILFLKENREKIN